MMEEYTLIIPNIEGGLIVHVDSEGGTKYYHAMKWVAPKDLGNIVPSQHYSLETIFIATLSPKVPALYHGTTH